MFSYVTVEDNLRLFNNTHVFVLNIFVRNISETTLSILVAELRLTALLLKLALGYLHIFQPYKTLRQMLVAPKDKTKTED